MLKETIHYEDFNGQERTVVAYFNLTEKQVTDLQAHSEEGIQADLDEALKSNNAGRVLDYITNLVHLSYGVKSQDGKNFYQGPEILKEFTSAAFYSDFLMGLIQDDGKKGQEFVQGIMPKKLVDRALAQSQGQVVGPPDRVEKESVVHAPSAREQFAQRQGEIRQPVTPTEFVPTQVSPTSQNPAETHNQQDERERAEFLAWKAQQEAARQAPQTPAEGFRVPAEEETMPGLPRPPHEQQGSVQ